KIILKGERVHWHVLSGKIKNCNIDRHAKIYEWHILSNVTVGKGTYIAYNASILDTHIGKFCSIGPNLVCGWGLHPVNGISTSPVFYSTRGQVGFSYCSTNKFEEKKPIYI